jgi:phage tail-like protein
MAFVDKNRSSLATDPIRNFRFLVNFSPLNSNDTNLKDLTATMGFTSVSGMAVTTDSIPYREGGYNTTVHQIPGQTSFQPVTLQRGVLIGNKSGWNWMKNMFYTVQNGGNRTINQNFRCDIEISVLPHPISQETIAEGAQEQTAMRFKFYNCWPTALAYSDLNAGDNSLLVEQMTLVHEGFDTSFASFDASKKFVSAPAVDQQTTAV